MTDRLPPVRIAAGHAGVVRCEPQWSWAPNPARVVDFDLWFVWAGRGVLRADGTDFSVRAGDVFCLRPGGLYQGRHDPRDPLGVTYVHFDFVDPRTGNVRRPPRGGWPPLHARFDDVGFYDALLRQTVLLAQASERGDDALASEQAASYLRGALMAMGSAAAAAPAAPAPAERRMREAVAAAARDVRENPGAAPTVAAMAARAGYSVHHFTRAFRRVSGVTPKEYQVRERLRRALHLLRESDMTLGQVAASLGYADVFFFSRQFKQRTGVAPTAWRKREDAGARVTG